MDRNSLTGFILIGLIFVGFYFISRPTSEQLEYQQRQAERMAQEENVQAAGAQDTAFVAANDSSALAARFGVFASAASGEENFRTVETDLLKIKFSNKGGAISSVELKNYKTGTLEPLVLFDGEEENVCKFVFPTAEARSLTSTDLYFEALPVAENEGETKVSYRLHAADSAYMDFVYTLPEDNYMIRFDIEMSGMERVLAPNMMAFEVIWNGKVRQQEKGRDFENRYSGLSYKYLGDDVESLNETSDDTKDIPTKLKWVSFKDQFFSSILIADKSFDSAKLSNKVCKSGKYMKECSADMYAPLDGNHLGFSMYFGPNHFKTLNSYDKHVAKDDKLDLQRLVPLGWALFRWVNRVLVIPMFNWFGSFISNFGIVILLMTIVIKVILFPLTYKSYVSTAKMRVLRPEIEKINAKYPQDKMQERQKATMDLYNRAGVNPMGGCLPMLLQMPILIAMFSFFPAAIELRQESFLWASDLSSYDSIFELPFNIPFYGSHVSLFCLLMTIVNIIYTKVNMAATDTGNQMPGMKIMMYLMPVMFLFFFNSYASGLTYYYFISLLITIIQTYIIRATVDEEKLLAKLNENKKKPVKKSGWVARLEKMQREQLEAQRKNRR